MGVIAKILAHLTGQPGGQTLTGGTATGEDLTLKDNTTDNNTTTVTLIRAGLLTGTQKTDLTDAGDSTLHYHTADRNADNHVGGSTNAILTVVEKTRLLLAPQVLTPFTYDMSTADGTQNITSINGVPKLIEFKFSHDETEPRTIGSGSDDGTTATCMLSGSGYYDPPGMYIVANETSGSYSIKTMGDTNYVRGKITTMGTTSVITWDKVGSPTGTLTVHAVCHF